MVNLWFLSVCVWSLLTKSPGNPRVKGKVGGEWAEMQNFVPRWAAFIKISPSDGIRSAAAALWNTPCGNWAWFELLGMNSEDSERIYDADCVSQLENINFFVVVYFWLPDVLTGLVLGCRVGFGVFLTGNFNYQGRWVKQLSFCCSSFLRNHHPEHSQCCPESWSKYSQALLDETQPGNLGRFTGGNSGKITSKISKSHGDSCTFVIDSWENWTAINFLGWIFFLLKILIFPMKKKNFSLV